MANESVMDASERILGKEKLTSIFGYWPSFHDAEILWLHMDRSRGNGSYGPTLEALVHTWEMTNEVTPEGYYKLRHHVLVHFRFLDVVAVQLEDFNYQNVLYGLTITNLQERESEHVRYQVSFDSSFGLDGSFQCHEIEVVSVEPGDANAAPFDKTHASIRM
jgi:hypothetical protein